ncbi:MAG: hypothetical protein KKD44_21855 [Proteobacteria bacterium]|nr:hypothetical protein [Pseudomonadota bacterium]
MMEKPKRTYKTYLIYTAMALGIAGMIYGFYSLYTERNRLEASLTETESRLAQVEKKYTQEKNLTQGLIRTKQSLEGLLRGMEAKVKEANEEKEQLLAEKEHLEENWVKKSEAQTRMIADLNQRIEKMKEVREEIIARYKEKVEIIQKNEKMIADLTQSLHESEYELKRTSKKLDMCSEHNGRLCTINEELVEMYKNKGLVNVLSVTEPLTQLRKVEMEKMVQQYKTKIDENRENQVGGS